MKAKRKSVVAARLDAESKARQEGVKQPVVSFTVAPDLLASIDFLAERKKLSRSTTLRVLVEAAIYDEMGVDRSHVEGR